MSHFSKIPPHVLDAAADWLVLLHSGEMTEIQQQQFEQWKAEKKQHALAIQQIEKFTQGLTGLANDFPSESLVQSNQKFNQTTKRNMLFSLSGLFVLGLAMYLMPWAKWQSDYHTEIGEIKTIPLKDGSQLILASDSYIQVNFSQQIRQIKLIEGEIYIQTAKDPQHRPFMVETQNGSVEALGTQFTVRQEHREQTKVKVYQHAVAIQPQASSQRQILQQGQRAFFDSSHISKPIALENDKPYWTQQLLVVEQWPLQKVLDELYRYKKGTYFIDPELKDIHISGVFSLQNTQQSLETLAYTHQLELSYYSPYLLKIKKR
ncbi:MULTISPECIES: FecR family protein [unclassified Acinetobacter]|uniref:FecR family protein n=1 Tax=unclassified Acinetobacter TaxID=196816 RepID=UPI002446B21E|nr:MULTISPECIES: FecR family protein [unclassified Acinetobacter]MDH0032243.1 FecR family protein [Acinetobacter sp. GD04021]MDH0887529.1 FecR family protein [Acinetobacter sp. GD03873]MDH1084213.1 FecR family protein [Acinetobacter sp. GD03983]MDH2190857.1 FecR family protein [Acinetobacter sp. GD03645]MDH2203872.1 FecR family protein [Acinetobacter sp. GD03647]